MNEVKLHVAGIDGFFSDARQAAERVESGDLAAQGAVIAFESMDVLLKALTAGRWRWLCARPLAPQGFCNGSR